MSEVPQCSTCTHLYHGCKSSLNRCKSYSKLVKKLNGSFTEFLFKGEFTWSITEDITYPEVCKICPANDGDYCKLGECGWKYNLDCNIDMKNRKVTVIRK